MNLFLHTCCGPCLLYPIEFLNKNDINVTGYFYNPNIHPYKEFKRRLITLEDLCKKENISLLIERDYGLTEYMRNVVFNEDNRCSICYLLRLKKTASLAKQKGFDAFSTTLLYSRYQQHTNIIEICRELATLHNIEFYYHDFRAGWQQGIDASISKDLYRQPYCGCVYSEQERYDNRLKKKFKKENRLKRSR